MSKKRTKSDELFEDLGFDPVEAEKMETKANLYAAIKKIVQKKQYSQKDVEKLLDIRQPRASDLLTGKLKRFRIDRLIEYLVKLGGSVEVTGRTTPRKWTAA